MHDCKKLESVVTPYVDGQLDSTERADVDAHLRACPRCHARVVVEQSVRDLLSARKQALKNDCASDALRTRCAGFAKGVGVARSAGLKSRATYGANTYGATRVWSRLRPVALAA